MSPALACERMTAATRADAAAQLAAFLGSDDHYRASAAIYGDGGTQALERSLDLFLGRPEIGFVWLAYATTGTGREAVAACVVCRAISTSRGTVVAKLDDVTVDARWQGRGVGATMLGALADHLRAEGMSRIDCGCHRDNAGAWRFYERLGFRPLDEERLAWLL
ncbi:MAG: GNAT family N-acetyltransferase [Burkholderiales bacterium]